MLEQETPNIASMASLPTLSAPGLLVMDVDSTLIDEEVIDELGVAAGVGEQIASVTARAMNGELDFREALRARVALWKVRPTTMGEEVEKRDHGGVGRPRFSMRSTIACISRMARLN